MASLTIEVDNGSGSFVSVNAARARVSRRVGPGSADFTVPNASSTDRDLIQPGREVHITLTADDGSVIRFGGYVGKPRVIVGAPGSFNLDVDVVSLNHGAALKMILYHLETAPITYSTVIENLWSAWWPSVDRSGIQSDPTALTEDKEFTYTDLASVTTEICNRILGNWVWWVEWTGTGSDKAVKAGAYHYQSSGVTLGEMDVLGSYELAPQDWDYRNQVHIVGGNGGGPDPEDPQNSDDSAYFPVYAFYPQSNPSPYRPVVIQDPDVTSKPEAEDRAKGEWWNRQLRYKVRFGVKNYGLEPGHILTLDLPTVGIDSDTYAVSEVEDEYERGVLDREVELEEVLTP